MHITSVILDGFKSYADRTDIGPFDRHFNAITGLNGSGKSNILDGIVFVLGLSSLSTVRAQSLADLIHKGSTAVKKATASIVFNNQDKRPGKCPPGFEKYNEIIVSRTIEPGLVCRYHLNGSVSTKKQVQDMFESVHLNINNPNFMIMQGKITKVVNMKPKELLHMIEETVGALSYQIKRDKSCKEILERDLQLLGTTRLMDEVVRPAITRQLKAAKLIDEYKDGRIRLDRISAEYAKGQFAQYMKEMDNCKEKINKMESTDKHADDKIAEIKSLVKDKIKEKQYIENEAQAKAKEKLAKLEKTKGAERKKLAGIEAQFEAANENVEDAKGKVNAAEKAYQEEVKQVENYRKKSSTLIAEFEGIRGDITNAQTALKTAKDQEAELESGKILGDDGRAINLKDRLVLVEEEIEKIRPNFEHESKLLANETKNLKLKQAQLAKTPSDDQIEKDYKTAEMEVGRLKRTLAQKQLVPEEYTVIEKRVEELKGSIHKLEQKKRSLTSRYPFLNFEYKNPTPHFDKRKISGLLYEMFELKDMAAHKKGIEVLLGGSPGVVIVDTPETSRDLINSGSLRYRTNFMAISTMRSQSKVVTQNELDNKLGRNKAIPAINCVNFEEKHRIIIEHYFGSSVLCCDMPTAKTVAFQLHRKAVTFEGDVIASDGAMTGGCRPNVGEYITLLQDLRNVVRAEQQERFELRELEVKLEHYSREAQLLNEFERATRNLQNANSLRQCTAYATLSAEIVQLDQTVDVRSRQIKTWQEEMNTWENEHQSLREKFKNFEDNKTRSMNATKALIQKWTKALETANKKYEAKNATFKDIELELSSKDAIVTNCAQDIEQCKKDLIDFEEERNKKKALLDEVKAGFDAKDADYEDARKEDQLLNDQILELDRDVDALNQRIQETELSKISRDNARKELEEKRKGIKGAMEYLKKKYSTLDFSEPEKFPKPTKKLSVLKQDLEQREKDLDEKRLRLDYASAAKAEESQAQMTTALERVSQVKKNRIHIQEAIDILDIQKTHLVTNAFESINTEFGAMMKTLLPESQAKLVPVQEGNLEAGVNIHVCLGGIWKESLSELSGGQRSLVALALVLSLCLFCPAPFYVLDEVDAALDLSHTQNIGVIIQQRFKDTQFVCVSLKDGMYSNANTLFQTSFTNGKSAVTRSYSSRK